MSSSLVVVSDEDEVALTVILAFIVRNAAGLDTQDARSREESMAYIVRRGSSYIV